MYFENRKQAGEKLAAEIIKKFPDLKSNPQVVVLALPRGGIPVAYEIAKTLKTPLDLIVTHKIGSSENPEFAIGAVAEDGSSFLDKNSCEGISKDFIKEEIRSQMQEIKKRIEKYRAGKPLPPLKNKTVILVDDGIATGNTMRAAIALAKNARAKRVIVAVPVLPAEILGSLKKESEVVFLDTPFPFFAIGRFYNDFSQLSDNEVRNYLAASK